MDDKEAVRQYDKEFLTEPEQPMRSVKVEVTRTYRWELFVMASSKAEAEEKAMGIVNDYWIIEPEDISLSARAGELE